MNLALKSVLDRWTHRWAKHFLRNHVLVLIGVVAYFWLSGYLWSNYGLIMKRTPVGSIVAAIVMVYAFFGWLPPLRYVEEYPQQLLKAERLLLALFVLTFLVYSIGVLFSGQSVFLFDLAAGFGPAWLISFFAYMMIFRAYGQRALARLHISKQALTEASRASPNDPDLVKRNLRLLAGGLSLYNRYLAGSYGLKIRDMDRFCKPIVIESLAQTQPGTIPVDKIDGLILPMKQGPLAFLKSGKTMIGQSTDKAENLYEDIEIVPGYVQTMNRYLIPLVTILVSIVGLAVTAYSIFAR